MSENSRESLKNQALKERMGEQVANYEDTIAELRVDYTTVVNAYQELREENEELKKRVETLEEDTRDREVDEDTERDSGPDE